MGAEGDESCAGRGWRADGPGHGAEGSLLTVTGWGQH